MVLVNSRHCGRFIPYAVSSSLHGLREVSFRWFEILETSLQILWSLTVSLISWICICVCGMPKIILSASAVYPFFIHNKLFTCCWIRIHSILGCRNWFIKSVEWYNCTVSCYMISSVMHAFWLVLTYDPLEDRRIDSSVTVDSLNQSRFFAKHSNQSVRFIIFFVWTIQ